MCIWYHCPVGTQVSNCTFKVKLKNSKVTFQYSIYFVQRTSATGSSTYPKHDAATTILDSLYSVLGFQSFNFTPPNLSLVIVAKQFHLCP